MMTHNKRYRELASKWMDGTITPAEKAEFAAWYNAHHDDHLAIPKSFADNEQELQARIFEKIRKQKEYHKRTHIRKMGIRRSMGIAASLLLLVTMGVCWRYDLLHRFTREQPAQYEVQPGGNRATLTLTDGRTIDLSPEQAGIITGEGIRYQDGSSIGNDALKIENIPRPASRHTNYYTLTTPKGGRYQVSLPDGTKVWLNSESSLTYPAKFSSGKREVDLRGEAYFEVERNEERPFLVRSGAQEVQVLGTAFNVNSYEDEEGVKTTLVRGKVRIRSSNPQSKNILLQPGEQAVLQPAGFIVKQVDTEVFTAWKDGYFYFKDADIHTVMQRLSKWYDITVSYEVSTSDDLFVGKIPMNMTLNAVLSVLKGTGIEFELKPGRHLVVKKKTH